MILPQDTKEPLVDSDTELDFDLDEDDFVPPYSPAPTDHAPLLSHPDDIELCPPPYSDDSDVEAAWKRQPSLREQLQKRRTRILWSCLAIIALYTTFVTYFAAHHRRPRHPHHIPFGALGVGLADRGDCAVFPPGQPYPHRSDRAQRSSNATFLLPTSGGELFDQFRGDAVVGDIFVTAYDADDRDDSNDGAVYHGGKLPQEYVRMTVEAVYDVDSADRDESVGRDMLQASSVCLVRRPGPGRSHRSRSNGLGVDLYAVRPADIDHLPLHFRLHVQVPRSVERVERRSNLPPLLLQGAAGRVDVSALSGVPLSTLRIRTLAGSISVRDATAENLQLHASSGSVSGAVAVSQSLDVRTAAGEVDLDLSLAHAGGKCGPIDASINTKAGNIALRHGEWAECRTLREAVVSGAGNVDIAAHPRFEGGFRLDTDMGRLEVQETDAPDPDDKGRHRTIRKKESGGWGHQSVRGNVAWDDKRGKQGSQLKAETAVGKIKVAF